jgi:hypothetical protein
MTVNDASESTQPPIKWELGAPPQGIKWLGCEADHSPPPDANSKLSGTIPPLFHMSP